MRFFISTAAVFAMLFAIAFQLRGDMPMAIYSILFAINCWAGSIYYLIEEWKDGR